VPQGSVLGPLLFCIYIDGVTKVPLSMGSKLVLYADDMLLYRKIDCPEDYTILQWVANTINNWVRDNSLTFSVSKCKYMLIAFKKQGYCDLPDLLVDDLTHERVDCFKYLVVVLSPQTCRGRVMWNLSAPSHKNYWDFFIAGFTSKPNHQHYCSFIIPW